ncbi:TPA: prepilin-type N-terminal cleavage/methylation domain-containing protein [Legionella pneumophila]|nr:prepilin-type N-terminal cleavage/methylation domain-containing protein [Legionella pneumophila]HDV5805618.1 prepilin-type N-terminal cleavage/methylation domain-containing protein [Legionella pneumophila]
MSKHQGFTLMEVLVSLMLMTTVVLMLVEQQLKTRDIINHLIWRIQGSQYLDQVDEALNISENLPLPPSNYHFDIRRSQKKIILNVTWFKKSQSIIRSYVLDAN